MLIILSSISILVIFSLGPIQSQTSAQSDTATLSLGFSTYLSHTDKYATGLDIYSDSEGYTYIVGNTKDKNFPATEGAYQTELKGDSTADVFVVFHRNMFPCCGKTLSNCIYCRRRIRTTAIE